MCDPYIGKIYCIRSIHTDKVYVGSTDKPRLEARLKQHKDDYNRWEKKVKGSKYFSSYEILKLGIDDVWIELLDWFICYPGDDELLRRIEGNYILDMNSVNLQVPGQTKKQYRERNKQLISNQSKRYYQKNRKRVLERTKKYRKENKEERDRKRYELVKCEECGEEYKRYNKSRHIKTEKHLGDKFKPNICDCGSSLGLTNSSRKRHLRSKKHQEYLKKIEK